MLKRKNEKGIAKTEKFTKYLCKLSFVEFLGVAKILCIPYLNEETKELYAFEEIWAQMVDKFYSLKASVQKEILKILKQAVSESGGE